MEKESNESFNLEIKKILKKYLNDSTKLIPILQDVQKEFGYLSEDSLITISTELGISPAKVFGVATFFAHFTLVPKGKNIITACHVKKSGDIIKFLREKFNLSEDKITSDDGLVTLETVSCLGACGLAPVVLINDEVHGEMTVEKLKKLIENLLN
jgi:NADH-quinone oxidoreductase subunit E